jgi:PadR family transcriptional regulator PadR
LIPTQMLKGTLEGCVLAVLSGEERYGYEISQTLEGYGFGRVPEGTIYPLLLRLEKRGAITASYRASAEGPQRKYYALTDQGRAELAEFFRHYRELTRAVDQLMEETGGQSHE